MLDDFRHNDYVAGFRLRPRCLIICVCKVIFDVNITVSAFELMIFKSKAVNTEGGKRIAQVLRQEVWADIEKTPAWAPDVI
jgi:hypothetical protein